MPDLKPDVSLVLTLYQRCKTHRCLPYPGGLLEQPEWIMDLFDTIEGQKELHIRAEQERAQAEAVQARLKNEMEARTKRG